MKLSGVRHYLSKPSRAIIASAVFSAITVLLLLAFRPAFPENTAIYRMLSPVGEILVEPGDSVSTKFSSFTDFDAVSVAIFPDSPSTETDIKVSKVSDGYYSLTITNTGSDVLKLMAESPMVYKSIEPFEDGSVIDVSLYKSGSPNGMIFAYVTMFTALFVFFTSFAFLTNNLTPSKFYMISALTLGLGVYPILFPAWSGHDSDAHFQAAYRFSNILLGKGSDWVGRECDVEFFRGSWKRFVFEGGYRPDPSSDIYLPVVLNKEPFVSVDRTTIVPSDGSDYSYMLFYGIFNYLPMSIGMALARLLRLSPMYMIHLGRYLQGIVYVFLTWRAVKKIKSENTAFLLALVSSFPISLAYLTAFSYDGAVMTYAVCVIAQLICFKEENAFYTKKNIAEAAVYFFMLGSVKGGGYVVLLPIVFMILRKPLKERKNILPFFFVAISLLAVLLSNVILKPRGVDLFQLKGSEGFYSTDFALQHPLRYLMMCISTLLAFSGDLITDSVGRSEGWNEVAIPGVITVVILLGTILAAVAAKRVSRITKTQVIASLSACLLMFVCTPAMLLKDTPLDYSLIMGVQGRYFKPLAPLVIMLMIGLCEFAGSKLEKKSLEQISGKAGIVKSFGLILFAAGSAASVIAMVNLYLGR